MTTRQLVSHLAGIRHYEKKDEIEKREKEKERKKTGGERNDKSDDDEFSMKEYYLKDYFESTSDALKLFKDDELTSKPGED